MAFQLVNDGVLRDFRLFAPIGWQYWVDQAFIQGGRKGLPLVIALHGGLQDPVSFSDDWPFHLSNNGGAWDDRFFVLYPEGFAYTTVAGAPARGWNTGFSGEFQAQNDVKFIRNMIGSVEDMLRAELDEIGIKQPPIDAHRRFLFGYSMGGMLAYRLAHDMPDYFAAIWAMSAAYGGRSHDGLTPTVTNDPQGSTSLSLFAHHGENDDTVPPGPRNDPSGLTLSPTSQALYTLGGLPAADVGAHATSVRPLAAAIAEFKLYDDCAPAAFSSSTTEADLNGTNTSETYVFRQAGGGANPEVIVYRDPTMGHIGFTGSANRYFDQTDVWDFFKAHPRL